MEHIVKALNSEILHCIQKESWGQVPLTRY